MSDRSLLDSSVILSILGQEDGYEAAIPFLDNASISSVNYAEIVAKLSERRFPDAAIDLMLDQFQLRILPFDAAAARRAGLLRSLTLDAGLSLGDRACLAVAIESGLRVVTADRAWAAVDCGVDIRVIR
ncbi:PIN domain-containing protein [Hyphobacterium sp.]|uniref:PIN domain-containing protein n=1 Tax=Hyphobacterium sp. TaxID=2004662 RepID=UPI003BAC3561